MNIQAARRDIPELTAIRGIAAWAVVLHHFREFAHGVLPAFVQVIADHGYLAVDLFFVMSGYIMMHVHGNDFSTLGRPQTRNFLARRFARIYPLHFLLLILYAGVAVALQARAGSELSSRFSGSTFAVQLVLGQAFTGNWGLYSWNVPAWSLSVEAAAYLLFPIIAWPILRVKPRTLVIASLVLIVVLPVTLYFRNIPDLNRAIAEAVFRGVSQFALGCTLYGLQVYHRWRAPKICFVVVAGLLAVAATIGKAALILSLPTVLFAIATVTLQADSGLPGTTILRSRILLLLGEWSFSTYMVHYFIRDIAKALGTQPWLVPLWFLVIALLSAGVYRFYEVPARRYLSNRLLPKSRAAVA